MQYIPPIQLEQFSLPKKHLRGIEPTAFRLLVRRTTSCATETTDKYIVCNLCVRFSKFYKTKI